MATGTGICFRILFQIYDLIEGLLNPINSRFAAAGLSVELNILKRQNVIKILVSNTVMPD
jgi:hypothetical protein